jgi:hypothetical protein
MRGYLKGQRQMGFLDLKFVFGAVVFVGRAFVGNESLSMTEMGCNESQ